MTNQSPPTDLKPKPAIGLMGGPGSGKSTVASLFAELGCAVIDADRLAHEALQDDAVRRQVREWWGDTVFDASGQINRKALGKIVFADEQALRKLESVVHPLVHAGRKREREQHQANSSVRAIVEDCPLLMESGLDRDCEVLVFVDCPESLRLDRVKQSRGWDADELKKRGKQQLPLDNKRRSADYVIRNGETISRVREQVEHVLKNILE